MTGYVIQSLLIVLLLTVLGAALGSAVRQREDR